MKGINVRADFPILHRKIEEQPLVYLDNAATTQKPRQVIEAVEHYYQLYNANVHRGVYTLAQEATDLYEAARATVAQFIHARSTREVIFTRGTTTSLNWVAFGYVAPRLQPDDEILVSAAEHHANLVVWQQVAKRTQAKLVFLPLLASGAIDMEESQKLITERTKVLAIAHVSNVLGIKNDILQFTKWVHEVNGIVVVDGAQAVPHQAIDVQVLDCDFYAFSGHKMLAPTGIGVLYGKETLLEQMEPQEFGGEMIERVTEQTSTWAPLPWKFEAGTPNIAGAIGLRAAIDYINQIGMEVISTHEQILLAYMLPKMQAIEGITLYGMQPIEQKTGVISFNLQQVHAHDVATALDTFGISVRAGHHCAQPLMRHLNVPATVRASFYLYNTKEEVDAFIAALLQVKEYFTNDVF